MKTLTVILLVLSSWAVRAQSSACLQLAKVELKGQALHQAGDAEVQLTFANEGCNVWQDPKGPGVAVAEKPGLEVHYIDSSYDDSRVSANDPKAKEITVTLRLEASSRFSVGSHKLPARITYQIIDDAGNISPQAIFVYVPFEVAPKLQPTKLAFSEQHPVWSRVLIQLEVIALLPLWILSNIISGSDC